MPCRTVISRGWIVIGTFQARALIVVMLLSVWLTAAATYVDEQKVDALVSARNVDIKARNPLFGGERQRWLASFLDVSAQADVFPALNTTTTAKVYAGVEPYRLAEQYFHLLLWDRHYHDAADFADEVVVRLATAGLPTAPW